MNNRPVGITIIGALLFAASIIAFIIGISAIIPGTPLDAIWTMNSSLPLGFNHTFDGMIFGYFLIILGLIVFCGGWGFLKGRKWAWWIAVIIFAANAIGDAARIGLGGVIEGILGILIAVGFLYYLTRPGVRTFFENKQEEAD